MTEKLVVKANGEQQPFSEEKFRKRLSRFTGKLDTRYVDTEDLLVRIKKEIYTGIKSSELDNLVAETCAYMSVKHPDYSTLAGNLKASALHKETTSDYVEISKKLHGYIHPKTGKPAPLLSDDVFEIIEKNGKRLQEAIDYERDFNFDYFGFKTLERSYLLKLDGKIGERPQHMLMRVSVGIHKNEIEKAIETYDLLSRGMFIHASPTLFNAGTPKPQMSSCFLVCMEDDSIEGIYDTLKTCALISKSAGGIGLSVHKIRSSGSYIRGTNGVSNGLVPMLRVFNDTARYVDQGGGKRKGAFAIYLAPHHADIFEFLDLRKNNGMEEQRCRDLFLGLWIPDLFMKKVQNNEDWCLFCPNESPGLEDVFGDEFEALYAKYEREGRYTRKVKAQDLWFAIVDAQVETGTPYMLYKDACNKKSNQQNLGTIRSSNLCTEIIEYTAPDEVSVCNLASIALPKYVKESDASTDKPSFDHDLLYKVTKIATRNLNKIIDLNYYPVEAARKSNLSHRPIGIGVQGFADMLIKMRMTFGGEESRKLNKEIFETIYFASMESSMEIAKELGPYKTFEGSPLSKGKFQFDLWGVQPESNRWDWETLRKDVMKYGARNSLLLAPMPTASTSQILGNNEAIEPYTSNIYTRRVLSGEFPIINKHLVKDLINLGKWDKGMINRIVANQGSIQNIEGIPDELKELYLTVWEIKQKNLIDLAAERAPFICQSQSLNVFVAEPNTKKLTSMHFYAWKKGLKTGMYYLRTRPAADAIQFTVDQELLQKVSEKVEDNNNTENLVCRRRKKGQNGQLEECLVCGS